MDFSALFVTLVVFVSVKVVLVMLSVKVPRPVGGGGNSSERSVGAVVVAMLLFPADASGSAVSWILTVTDSALLGRIAVATADDAFLPE